MDTQDKQKAWAQCVNAQAHSDHAYLDRSHIVMVGLVKLQIFYQRVW